jgi:hypothetical protein
VTVFSTLIFRWHGKLSLGQEYESGALKVSKEIFLFSLLRRPDQNRPTLGRSVRGILQAEQNTKPSANRARNGWLNIYVSVIKSYLCTIHIATNK